MAGATPAFVTNYGFELPIFDADHVIGGELTLDKIPNTPTFVRQIMVTGLAHTIELRKLLRVSRSEFETLAELCEATVIPYSFGLARGRARLSASHPDTPGYQLVAEVPTLAPSTMTPSSYNSQTQRIRSGCVAYQRQDRRYALTDIGARQFMSATLNCGRERVYLTDIDITMQSK